MSAAQNLPTASYPERLLSPLLNYQLAMDVALGVDVDTILEAYSLQFHELEAVRKSGIFLQQLKEVEAQLREKGGAFRMKAQAQAEELLKESFKMAVDPDTDPKVRADMIKANVRWAGYDTPAQNGAGSGGGFTVNINLSGTKETTVYEHGE